PPAPALRRPVLASDAPGRRRRPEPRGARVGPRDAARGREEARRREPRPARPDARLPRRPGEELLGGAHRPGGERGAGLRHGRELALARDPADRPARLLDLGRERAPEDAGPARA